MVWAVVSLLKNNVAEAASFDISRTHSENKGKPHVNGLTQLKLYAHKLEVSADR
jgi:hypothetical protein